MLRLRTIGASSGEIQTPQVTGRYPHGHQHADGGADDWGTCRACQPALASPAGDHDDDRPHQMIWGAAGLVRRIIAHTDTCFTFRG
jgi:hypothetical protein